MSNMVSSNSAELRLRLMDSLAKTISNLVEEEDTEDGRRQNELALEDLSEAIINDLGIIIPDEENPDGSFTAIIPKQ